MERRIRIFVGKIKHVTGINLHCVLLLGSVQQGDPTPFSDTDLVVILKTFNLRQMTEIRLLVRKSQRLWDISFLCWDEIPTNPNEFRIGTHGCYQLMILQRARCVAGRNILLQLEKPSEKHMRISMLEKIQQYTWWARRMFVESNRERSIESNYQLNSRIIKVVRDFLYLAGYCHIAIQSPAKEAMQLFLRKKHFLKETERKALARLVDKKFVSENTADMSDAYLEMRFSVINKIHKKALRLFCGAKNP